MEGKSTEHADEEGLVDQFVALWIDEVELEGQAAPLLPLLMAVLQQTCKTGTRARCHLNAGSVPIGRSAELYV